MLYCWHKYGRVGDFVRGLFLRGISGEGGPPLGVPKLQHLHYTADTPKFCRGDLRQFSLKTKVSHEITPPPPVDV